MPEKSEDMREFFCKRIDFYEEHMLKHWSGFYNLAASLIPDMTKTLLDLGCGTGLELDGIFRRLPNISVTGIDLTPEMLDKLKQKYSDKKLTLIEGDFFALDLEEAAFDAAISFESLHHFPAERKAELYKRLYKAIKPGGIYIECDYMVQSDEEEAAFEKELLERRKRQCVPDGKYLHFDCPLTVSHQIKLLCDAGFRGVRPLYSEDNTVLLLGGKAR